MVEEQVRVVRLIVYEGPRSLVEKQISQSLTGTRDGMRDPGTGKVVTIQVVTLGSFPEVLEKAKEHG